ncbi:response regulator [Tsuneonella sp. SYSU-LHT278]|uniref:response regulator n=1 Tax=Tsuneonella sediminis TaxID=3416089 RepID=UPI003F78C92B
MGTTPPREAGPSGLRVLIVEDEALVAMELEFMLEEAGYLPVGNADDLASAIEVVETSPPDLALVDIQLAMGESGLRVARELRERGIPVLFATGNCPGESGRPVAVGCLHKPIVERSLRSALHAVEAKLAGREVPKLPSSVHLY